MERGIITINENGVVTIPTAPVWMTQQEMSDAFSVFCCDIRRVICAIYKNMELLESDTMRYIRQGNGISYDVYSLEMVITVAFRLRTKECMAFRRFVIGRLKANDSRPINLFFSLSPI
ncbi:transporter [Bacteroides sp. NSJ-21]|uniref:Transporter n=1 Tax=Bacteroides parvus TaxID=2763025 RepID=A0ABR7C5G5_9BACE|nr:transporter [Bacteroides parvus]MBC5592839.1 transporter [Bacteroides parvus]